MKGEPTTVAIKPEMLKESDSKQYQEEEPTQSQDISAYDLQIVENAKEKGVTKINPQNISEMINDDEIFDDYEYN